MSASKKLPPSAKKQNDARKKGDIAKSREFTSAICLSSGVAYIFFCRGRFADLALLLEKTFVAGADFHSNNMLVFTADSLSIAWGLTWPLLLLVVLTTLVAETAQIGFLVSFAQLAPNLGRLDFFKGIKRLFSWGKQSPTGGVFVDSLRFFVYLIGFLLACLVLVLGYGELLLGWQFQDITQVMEFVVAALLITAAIMLGVLLFLGVLDLSLQKRRRAKRLAMDINEFRRELRETSGDPEIKGMRRQLQQELLQHGLAQSVRRARVVVIGRE